jgi:hypothetical protein
MNGHVRQGGGAVAAYTRTAETMDAYVSKVSDGDADVDESTTTDLGVVGATGSRRNREGLVGIVAVTEPAS